MEGVGRLLLRRGTFDKAGEIVLVFDEFLEVLLHDFGFINKVAVGSIHVLLIWYLSGVVLRKYENSS